MNIQAAANVTPSLRQLNWQKMEFYAFAHFGMNTFTNREWGDGSEPASLFCPTEFDPDQWGKCSKKCRNERAFADLQAS